MDLKHTLAKVISVFLIGSSLYQTFLSVNAIFFIYPNLEINGPNRFTLQTGLIEKAIVLYISMIAAGIYGLALLLKPIEEVNVINISLGLIIFFISVFFVSQTPFTYDPLLSLLQNYF